MEERFLEGRNTTCEIKGPLVSICCITYNHEEYIKDAIEGFLMQRTSFNYEIIIHDDCSTDNTAQIVEDYRQRNPDLIITILQTENQRSKGRKIFPITFQRARGKYIALCEGDDYWTDPYKLQKQVEFLDAHPECSMCFHDAYNLYPDGSKEGYAAKYPIIIKLYYDLQDLLTRHFIPTCSVVFRSSLIGEFPDAFCKIQAGDKFLFVLLAEKGKLGFIPQFWGIRRIHPGGIYSMRPPEETFRWNIQSFEIINAYLGFRYERVIRPEVSRFWYHMLHALLQREIQQEPIQSLCNKMPEMLNDWVRDLPPSKTARNYAFGEIYLDLARQCHRSGSRAATWSCLVRAIRHNPALLARPRMWLAGVRKLLVQPMAARTWR